MDIADRIKLLPGDCIDVLPTLADDSLDSCVTDPPYHLTSIVKRFGKSNLERDESNSPLPSHRGGSGNQYKRVASGFMGKQWDGGAIAQSVDLWRQVYRVLKPGAHLVAFGGTRTYHRMACAIEDAGFEIRDCIQWLYGSGFPKSHDVSKGIDRRGGVSVNWFGPWLRKWREEKQITQKQVAALFPSKTGGFTGCVANWELGLNLPTNEQFNLICKTFGFPFASMQEAEREIVETRYDSGGRTVSILGTEPQNYDVTTPATDAARQWEGWGTALKPACEPIVLARKPLSERTVAANVLRWGTGAINVDGCRVATPCAECEGTGRLKYTPQARCFRCNGEGIENTIRPTGTEQFKEESGWNSNSLKNIMGGSRSGRWPGNLIHDGSDEVLAGFPDRDGGAFPDVQNSHDATSYSVAKGNIAPGRLMGDSGSAARFFYQVKQDEPCEQNVSNAERCFLGCHRQTGDIAPLIAPTQDESKVAQNVKSAANLCDSCAIAIAQNLAALKHGQNPALDQFKDIIGERNALILSQCLALYVVGRESTDIILTTESLKQLFGSVSHAIATCIEENDYDRKTAPEKLRRFWYTSKADSDDRIGSKHPTVKPLDLMQYLVRLVTPKGGTCLDMFAGSGTTGEAAFREGMKAVLIEREAEYLKDIQRRMELCMAGPVERQHASIKAKLEGKPRDDGPLFGGGDPIPTDGRKIYGVFADEKRPRDDGPLFGGTDWDSMWQKPFDKPELL